MKRPRIPKFIRELYNPSMKEWLRWLRFRRKAIELAKQGHDQFEEYYHKCAKHRHTSTSGFVRSGMYPGSGSSTKELEIFPWAWFSRRVCFQGVAIDVTVDCHDSDIRSIAYTNDY